ncbi:MAG: Fe-S cluster assembly protein SufD [Thermoplasmatota archaeon]
MNAPTVSDAAPHAYRSAFADRLRKEAHDLAAKRGFPAPRSESWRGTPVGEFSHEFPSATSASLSAEEAGVHFVDVGGPRLVFVNGRYDAHASKLDGAAKDVVALPFSQVESAADRRALEERLSKGLEVDGDNVFAAINTSRFHDGAFIRFGRGALQSHPIQILHIVRPPTNAGNARPATFSRSMVLAEENAEGGVIETFAATKGPDSAPYVQNAISTIDAAPAARVQFDRVQVDGLGALHVAATRATLARNAFVAHRSFTLGSRLTRHDVDGVFAGEGGELVVDGLFTPGNGQHMDNHTRIDHAQPHCASREFYKGVLQGSGRGIFFGRIVVQKGAQKTDAKQTNRNLVLSDAALVDSTPQLEIYADDVRCTHASATGQIDEDAIFYLQTRGIGDAQARRLLTHAFAQEITLRIPLPALREKVDAAVAARIDDAAAQARRGPTIARTEAAGS